MQTGGMLRGTRSIRSPLILLVPLILLIGLAHSIPLQSLPSIPGYIPVYIRNGDQPLEEINLALAEAFHERSSVPKSINFDQSATRVNAERNRGNTVFEKSKKKAYLTQYTKQRPEELVSKERNMTADEIPKSLTTLHNGNDDANYRSNVKRKPIAVPKEAIIKVDSNALTQRIEDLDKLAIQEEKTENSGPNDPYDTNLRNLWLSEVELQKQDSAAITGGKALKERSTIRVYKDLSRQSDKEETPMVTSDEEKVIKEQSILQNLSNVQKLSPIGLSEANASRDSFSTIDAQSMAPTSTLSKRPTISLFYKDLSNLVEEKDATAPKNSNGTTTIKEQPLTDNPSNVVKLSPIAPPEAYEVPSSASEMNAETSTQRLVPQPLYYKDLSQLIDDTNASMPQSANETTANKEQPLADNPSNVVKLSPIAPPEAYKAQSSASEMNAETSTQRLVPQTLYYKDLSQLIDDTNASMPQSANETTANKEQPLADNPSNVVKLSPIAPPEAYEAPSSASEMNAETSTQRLVPQPLYYKDLSQLIDDTNASMPQSANETTANKEQPLADNPSNVVKLSPIAPPEAYEVPSSASEMNAETSTQRLVPQPLYYKDLSQLIDDTNASMPQSANETTANKEQPLADNPSNVVKLSPIAPSEAYEAPSSASEMNAETSTQRLVPQTLYYKDLSQLIDDTNASMPQSANETTANKEQPPADNPSNVVKLSPIAPPEAYKAPSSASEMNAETSTQRLVPQPLYYKDLSQLIDDTNASMPQSANETTANKEQPLADNPSNVVKLSPIAPPEAYEVPSSASEMNAETSTQRLVPQPLYYKDLSQLIDDTNASMPQSANETTANKEQPLADNPSNVVKLSPIAPPEAYKAPSSASEMNAETSTQRLVPQPLYYKDLSQLIDDTNASMPQSANETTANKKQPLADNPSNVVKLSPIAPPEAYEAPSSASEMNTETLIQRLAPPPVYYKDLKLLIGNKNASILENAYKTLEDYEKNSTPETLMVSLIPQPLEQSIQTIHQNVPTLKVTGKNSSIEKAFSLRRMANVFKLSPIAPPEASEAEDTRKNSSTIMN